MNSYFRDYFWKKGRPYGLERGDLTKEGVCYRIAADPYNKRICVERYKDGLFETTVYDSGLLDFRMLMSEELPPHWEREPQGGSSTIKDAEDRVLWVEKYTFLAERCISCEVRSAHGLLLSTHKLFYTALGDTFDGVILYDAIDKIVLYKRYNIEASTGLFAELLEVLWEWEPARCGVTWPLLRS